MIPLNIPFIHGNEWKYIKECLDTNWVSSAGSFVDLFEESFRKYIGSKKAVVTMNGTSALHLALRCLDIKEGDEVIVPSLTFVSPVNAVLYAGAKPVFVDVCRDTYVMDADKVEELITKRTKAILPVHIYGHPAAMDKLMELACRYGLYVIEDATESLGSLYKGRQTGTIGHIGCFSFNGNKLLTTGGGGMLVTNDEKTGEHAKYLSNQAKTVYENGGFFHEEIGYNYRMPNLLAAMGTAQLENIESFIASKRKTAQRYSKLLKDVKGVTLPVEKEGVNNVNWMYSAVIESDYRITRDQLIKKLKENCIESRPFFVPIHTMPPYSSYPTGSMDITIELAQKGINLPSSVGLPEKDIDAVCSIISGNA